MKRTLAYLLLGLGLLAGCTSDTEKQGFDAVERFYGGAVVYTKGSHLSTNAREAQGRFLEMTLANPVLGRQFRDLRMPASNCAYLVYSNLTPTERQEYDYLKITLQDSATTHTYTFGLPELATVGAAVADLSTLMADLLQRDYLAATTRFNEAALGTTSPDSLAAFLVRAGARLSPFNTYRLHGYSLLSAPVAGQPVQLVRLFVESQGPQNDHRLLVVVNPRLRSKEKFLYGLTLVN